MNNQNNNQINNSPADNQDLINQTTDQTSPDSYPQPNIGDEETSSIEIKMSEAPSTDQPLVPPFVSEPQISEQPQTILTQATETPFTQEKEALKDFNSLPIDTPTPTFLNDSLDTSKSLTENPLLVSENKSQVLSQPDTEYKQELTPEPEYESAPEPKIETEMNSDYKSEPTIQTETNVSTLPQEDPEKIKQKIDEVLSYNTANNAVDPITHGPKTSSLLKTLFIISLLIFLVVVGGLAYFIFYQPTKTNSKSTSTPTPTNSANIPTQTAIVCELNGFIYNQGQSFPSSDGCNTCTCVSADNITCTEKECETATITPITSVTPITSAPIITPKASTTSSVKKVTPTLTESVGN